MKRSHVGFAFGGLIAGVVALVAVLQVSASRINTTLTAPQPTPCPLNWASSPSVEIRRQCAFAKATQDALTLQTEIALARVAPKSIPVPTPKGTPPPAEYIPPSAKEIRALDPIEFADGPPALRNITSIWQVGALPGRHSYDYGTLYVLARPPMEGRHALIATVFDGNDIRPEDRKRFSRGWEAPQDVGDITITNITGPTIGTSGPRGIVSFKTSSGKTGTFNIETEAWTFN